MKKTYSAIGLVCLLFTLVACGNSAREKMDERAESSSESVVEAVPTEEIETEENTEVAQEEASGEIEVNETVQEIGAEELQEEMQMGELTITFIGHASLKIETSNGTVIYVDPNYEGDYSAPADYILVTHGHGDHLPRPEVTLKETGKSIYYTEALHDGIYEAYDDGNVCIEAVPAGGNPNHDIAVCVGYLITADGYTIYHAGDTSKIDAMGDLANRAIDYAFFPIDGVYNMDAVEATEAAKLVNAKYNIPIHALDDNHTGKADAFTPDGKITLQNGESIVLAVR